MRTPGRPSAKRKLDFRNIDDTPQLSTSLRRPTAAVAELGERVGSSDCKRDILYDSSAKTGNVIWAPASPEQEPNKVPDNTLLYTPNLLDAIVQGDEINRRERALVNLRGIHIKFTAINGGVDRSKTLHVALVRPQGNLTLAQLGTDFFRHYRSARGRDFSTPTSIVSVSNRISTLEIGTNPINADRFKVLMHKKIHLNSLASSSGNRRETFPDQPNMKTMEYYVPIERQIRYSGPTQVESDQLFFVYWFHQPNAWVYQDPNASTTPFAPTTNLVQWQGTEGNFNTMFMQIIGYFREPGA